MSNQHHIHIELASQARWTGLSKPLKLSAKGLVIIIIPRTDANKVGGTGSVKDRYPVDMPLQLHQANQAQRKNHQST